MCLYPDVQLRARADGHADDVSTTDSAYYTASTLGKIRVINEDSATHSWHKFTAITASSGSADLRIIPKPAITLSVWSAIDSTVTAKPYLGYAIAPSSTCTSSGPGTKYSLYYGADMAFSFDKFAFTSKQACRRAYI